MVKHSIDAVVSSLPAAHLAGKCWIWRMAWAVLIAATLNSHALARTVQTGIHLSTTEQSIYLGDSIVVELEAVGLIEELDPAPLLLQAELLRETTGTRIAVIDGKVVEVRLRRMEFLPAREGQVIFGPIRGVTRQGEVFSNTLNIEVLPPADTQWQPQTDELQIVFSLSRQEPRVGEHLVVDIGLRHQYPIADESVSLPDFAGFDKRVEYEQRRTIEQDEKGQNWRIVAWRYHLFARHSGPLVIDGVRWSGTVIRSRTQRADFERQTDPVQLQILPAAYTDGWWLPATRISLSDQWSRDPRELSAGDEIIRTITLEADEVLASHLPEVTPLQSRALSTTLIRQQRSDRMQGDRLIATATFDYRMIAQSPIPVFLDTVRVPWFDTLSRQPREAIIPARRINVGLPERADLLADIAMQQSVLEKWRLLLRSRLARAIPWHYSLALLSLLALFLWGRELRARYRGAGQGPGALPGL